MKRGGGARLGHHPELCGMRVGVFRTKKSSSIARLAPKPENMEGSDTG
jgi:hypothetical protein